MTRNAYTWGFLASLRTCTRISACTFAEAPLWRFPPPQSPVKNCLRACPAGPRLCDGGGVGCSHLFTAAQQQAAKASFVWQPAPASRAIFQTILARSAAQGAIHHCQQPRAAVPQPAAAGGWPGRRRRRAGMPAERPARPAPQDDCIHRRAAAAVGHLCRRDPQPRHECQGVSGALPVLQAVLLLRTANVLALMEAQLHFGCHGPFSLSLILQRAATRHRPSTIGASRSV